MTMDMDGFSVTLKWDQSCVPDSSISLYRDDIAIVTHGWAN